MVIIVIVLFRLSLTSFVAISSILTQLLNPPQLFLLFLYLFMLSEFLLMLLQFFLFLFLFSLAMMHRRVHAIIAVMMCVDIDVVIVFTKDFTFLLCDFLVEGLTVFFY